MNVLPILLLILNLSIFSEACSRRTSPTVGAEASPGDNSKNTLGKGANGEEEEEEEEEAEGSSDTEDENPGDAPSTAGGNGSEDKVTQLTEQVKQLEAQKKVVEEELKKLKANPPRIEPKAGEKGPSGKNYCPATGYYGDIILCGAYFCAKADSAFTIDCEAHPGSKQVVGASGYLPCPGFYYGPTFTCGTLVCAKSDPDLVNICQI